MSRSGVDGVCEADRIVGKRTRRICGQLATLPSPLAVQQVLVTRMGEASGLRTYVGTALACAAMWATAAA
jgi:hypothetical protein